MAKEKRFEKIYSQGAGSVEIWVDKETGVNYLYHANGYGGGYNMSGGNGGCSTCDICQGLICADCCCECMGGDLISCC